MIYELHYWPGLQGRGEFVRLALEEAGAEYIDIARGAPARGRGMPAMMQILKGEGEPYAPFAPPFLKCGDVIVSHVANILLWLGPRIGLAPAGEPLRTMANGLQLTITDIVAEVHDTHHPISTALYYEDQKEAARARTQAFLKERMPKYLHYFERSLARNPAGAGHMVGDALTYVDLSIFQLLEGLDYSFPRRSRTLAVRHPLLQALRERMRARPNIARYLQSERRLAFNETGVFRRYPELDLDPR